MPMTLYFKRAKAFVLPGADKQGTKKFLAQPGPSPQPVPFWVSKTATFEHGIADGSIVNLTPPHLMPGYAPNEAPVVVDEDVPLSVEAAATLDEEDVEQETLPRAAFGAQPMTPVQPAPKVGSIRRGGSRAQ